MYLQDRVWLFPATTQRLKVDVYGLASHDVPTCLPGAAKSLLFRSAPVLEDDARSNCLGGVLRKACYECEISAKKIVSG